VNQLSQFRVAIVGLGQIGGSIGLDLVSSRLVAEVIGYDAAPGVALRALERDAIDTVADSMKEAVADVDLVILAAPIRAIIRLLPGLAAQLPSRAAILDVAGTKGAIMATSEEAGLGSRYVSGHPMAGREGTGLAAAQAGIFRDADFALTVGDQIEPVNLENVISLVRGLGTRPYLIDPNRHDQIIALTSHLPHVVALAMGELISSRADLDNSWLRQSGGSLRSLIRVAGSSPQLILDMLATNTDYIVQVIDQLTGRLTELKKALSDGDEDTIRETAQAAQQVKKLLDVRVNGASE